MNSSSSHCQEPITVLMPVGLPVTRRTRSIMSSKSPALRMPGWPLGLTDACPTGMPRMRAMSGVTFSAGRMPPLPGLAPWLSLISNIFTDCRRATSRSFSSLRLPS